MNEDEAVLLRVRTDAHRPGTEVGVAALADVTVATLSAALADLVAGSSPGPWVLAPGDGAPPWPPDATLRGLGVLDGTSVVLRRPGSGEVSDARS